MPKLRLAALFLFVAIACHAQAGRTEVRGDLGWTGFLDESSDSHLLVGASLRTYLSRRTSFQPEFQYLTRPSNSYGKHYDLGLLANIAYDLPSPSARVVPYLIVGPGILHTRQTRFSHTGLFVSGGGGVKVFVSDRWYLAPDFRVGWEPHARFSVGLGYVFQR